MKDKVLLVLPAGALPREVMLRALAVSHLQGAALHVLRVVPLLRPPVLPLWPQLVARHSLRSLEEVQEVVEETGRWLEETGAWAMGVEGFEVRCGGLVEESAARARELGATLLVMPPAEGRFGSVATELARAAGVPVLVARPPQAAKVIVAATDLEDERYPVLRAAATLATQLDASIVTVHNVASPEPMPEQSPLPMTLTDVVVAARRTQLEAATQQLGVAASEVVVGTQLSDAAAILGEARARDADLVVVGTRERSLVQWLLGTSVASRVVEESRRSVLVLPLDPATELGAVAA